MQFDAPCVILGAKCFKGDVEGKHYDSTKIYVEEKMDESTGKAVGTAAVEYNAGKSDVFESIKAMPFPLHATLTIEVTTNGRQSKTEVKAIKPIHGAQSPKSPKL